MNNIFMYMNISRKTKTDFSLTANGVTSSGKHGSELIDVMFSMMTQNHIY